MVQLSINFLNTGAIASSLNRENDKSFVAGTFYFMEPEIWKDIPNTTYYQVSNYGRVKSLPKILKTPTGKEFLSKEIILKQHIDKKYGYCQYGFNIKGVPYRIHRLVALLFVDNPNKLKFNQVNHKDGIKTNNFYSNLEWCDNSMNQIHAYKIGLNKQKCGEDHHNSKLSNLQVEEIKLKYKLGISNKELVKQYKVCRLTIYRIINNQRKTYDSISDL